MRRRKKSAPTPPRSEAETPRSTRRGRPTKFGRPSQVVALTLPHEVLDALRAVHRDPAWAIVLLVDRLLEDGAGRRGPREPAALAELAHLPGGRALIVVQPGLFSRLRGISTIPLADGRAFVAIDQPGGLADLELAIVDRLEASSGTERVQLSQVRDILRGWRRDPALVFRTKSIIVVEGIVGVERRPLEALDTTAGTDGRKERPTRH